MCLHGGLEALPGDLKMWFANSSWLRVCLRILLACPCRSGGGRRRASSCAASEAAAYRKLPIRRFHGVDSLQWTQMSNFIHLSESDETTDETRTREAPSVPGRGLTFVLLRAVAVGFEPTVKLPPHTLSRRAPLAARTRYRGTAYRTWSSAPKRIVLVVPRRAGRRRRRSGRRRSPGRGRRGRPRGGG